MSGIPDCVSTLELSKIWIYKALKEMEAEREQAQLADLEPSEQPEQSDKEG